MFVDARDFQKYIWHSQFKGEGWIFKKLTIVYPRRHVTVVMISQHRFIPRYAHSHIRSTVDFLVVASSLSLMLVVLPLVLVGLILSIILPAGARMWLLTLATIPRQILRFGRLQL